MAADDEYSVPWTSTQGAAGAPPTRTLGFFRARVALFHLLKSMGVSRGDQVAVQAFTCVALAEAILSCGAVPVWIDIEPDTLNMDCGSLKSRLTGRTRAIVAQHTFGVPARLNDLVTTSRENGIPLIEDCCHSFGSKYQGSELGSFGAAAVWSYEWGKPVVAGVGGGLVVNDDGLRARVTSAYPSLCRHPPLVREVTLTIQSAAHRCTYYPYTYWRVRQMYRWATKLGIVTPSFNPVPAIGCPGPEYGWTLSRMTRRRLPQALMRAKGEVPLRIAQASVYASGMRPDAACQVVPPVGSEPVLSRFPIMVANKGALLETFARDSLELADFFNSPVHPVKGDRLATVGYEPRSCPNAERASGRVVSLPLGTRVSRRFQQLAIDLVNAHGRS